MEPENVTKVDEIESSKERNENQANQVSSLHFELNEGEKHADSEVAKISEAYANLTSSDPKQTEMGQIESICRNFNFDYFNNLNLAATSKSSGNRIFKTTQSEKRKNPINFKVIKNKDKKDSFEMVDYKRHSKSQNINSDKMDGIPLSSEDRRLSFDEMTTPVADGESLRDKQNKFKDSYLDILISNFNLIVVAAETFFTEDFFANLTNEEAHEEMNMEIANESQNSDSNKAESCSSDTQNVNEPHDSHENNYKEEANQRPAKVVVGNHLLI